VNYLTRLFRFIRLRRKGILLSIREYRSIRFNVRVMQSIAFGNLRNQDAGIAAEAMAIFNDGFRVRRCAWRVLRRLYVWRIFGVYYWPWMHQPFPRGIDEYWVGCMLPVYAHFMENCLEFIKKTDPGAYSEMANKMESLLQAAPES
jgi:hypothetical protein